MNSLIIAKGDKRGFTQGKIESGIILKVKKNKITNKIMVVFYKKKRWLESASKPI